MVFYVTPIVEKDIQELVQCAGKIAHQISVMMEHIAVSHHLMEEEQAKLKNVTTVKSMVVYGTQFVVMDTIMLAAVFVLPIVNMVWLILEFHAIKIATVEVLVTLLAAQMMKIMMLAFATISVNMELMVLAQSVGVIALQEHPIAAVHFA